MECIYAVMLLHKAGQKIDEASIKRILEASNTKIDETRIKALVACLDGVDIEKAMATVAAPVQATPPPEQKIEIKETKKPKEDKKTEKDAAAGLERLFG